jgi:outer membrane lipoprotein-sorting protein
VRVAAGCKILLRDAAAHYRNAQSFRIEFETKITSSSPFSNGWSKQIYIVATIDHKFHWEQKGSGLSGIRISDGESDWFYRPSIRE